MSGTLRERAPGVWRLQVYVGRDPITGREQRASRTFHGGKRQAERALAAFVTEVAAGRVGRTGPLTVGTLMDRWIEQGRKGWSRSTLRGYEAKLRLYIRPALGDVRLDRLTTEQVDRFYLALQDRGLAPRTIRQAHAALHRACRQAQRWGMLERNPVELASPPRVRKAGVKPPSRAEVAKLVLAADADFAMLVLLAAISGARRGELCGLRWSDVDLDAGIMRIERAVVEYGGELVEQDAPKTERSRRPIILDAETVRRLRAFRAGQAERALACGVRVGADGFVFADDPAARVPLRPERVTGRFRVLARRAGVACRFHDLRHFVGTELGDASIPVANISRRLGHARTSTTQDIYGHALDDTDVRAAQEIARRVYGERPAVNETAVSEGRRIGTRFPWNRDEGD